MHNVLAEVRTWHRPLMLMVSAMAALVLVSAIGLLVDSREILNESVWIKPFKFAFSFAAYGAALAWLLSRLKKAKRFGWWTGTVFALSGIIDVGFIAVQAARGTFSHFNTSTDKVTAIGAQVFSIGVLSLFTASLVIAIMLLFQKIGDKPLTRAIRAGVGLAFAGMAVALVLSRGDGERDHVTDAYGRPVELSGGHSIGVEPGGSGLPITRWSTEGGDLRVSHFFGMHALHALLALVLLLMVLATRVTWLRAERVRAQLVSVAAFAYTGLMTVTAFQAFRGHSVIRVDGATGAVLAGFAVVTVVALTLVVRKAVRQVPEPRTEFARLGV
ncbi:hypothetical protein [Kribbella antibiotica]|uniref:hypothetical protein n=1 Tax=Kribbella antibiotica TaxID=190195 RepID=UPI00192DAEE3|nr:hypothetical protein [Kribbella antibiotica]